MLSPTIQMASIQNLLTQIYPGWPILLIKMAVRKENHLNKYVALLDA